MTHCNFSIRDAQSICEAIDSLDIHKGDLTHYPCDVIVCPDGKMLDGVGGLAEKVHQVAGPMLKRATARLGECQVGQIKVTEAFQLDAKYIFHTVSPEWKTGTQFEEHHLANCYAGAMRKALDLQCSTIAFPSIGTGYHKFPKRRAAEIAVKVILHHLINYPTTIRASIVCVDEETYEAYKNALKQVVVNCFLELYSPESFSYNRLSASDMGPYGHWMVKLKNLETSAHDYSEFLGKIGFKDERPPELNVNQYYYLLSQKACSWDYRTCLAYIIFLQRKSYWDGYVSYHAEQCKLGGVRNVLMRMQYLLQAQ